MTNSENFREIILDTETTGLNFQDGDRIVEIGCVELINHIVTGKIYQTYINPQRKMHPDAIAISGITDEFLADKSLFCEIADDFLNFVGNSTLVIHNAQFDIGFLNNELERINKPLFLIDNVVDTLQLARQKFPGAPVNLDALCKRFKIDASDRTMHGALIDSKLLAEVYLNLLGGKQRNLLFEEMDHNNSLTNNVEKSGTPKFPSRKFTPTEAELLMHDNFLAELKNPIWKQIDKNNN